MANLIDTIVNGVLRVTGTLFCDKLQTNKINIPATSGGSDYGPGANGKIIKSNGTTVYWADDNNTQAVSSVAGKTGAVTLTSSDVGLGNVGNFKAVSTVASQGLNATEQSNARANIGAGTSSFSGSYNDLSNKPTIPSAVTESTVSGWGFTKNSGTVTSVAVKMNNSTKGTVTSSGTIDLGTVITSHQDISGKTDKATLTTKGDIYYASAANTPARLGIGTAGQVLKVSSSGIPAWSTDTDTNTFREIAVNSTTFLSSTTTTKLNLAQGQGISLGTSQGGNVSISVNPTETTETNNKKQLLIRDSSNNLQYDNAFSVERVYTTGDEYSSETLEIGNESSVMGALKLSYGDGEWATIAPEGACDATLQSSGTICTHNQNIGGTKLIKITRGAVATSTSAIGNSSTPVYVNSGTVTACSLSGTLLSGNTLNSTKYNPTQHASNYYKFLKIIQGFVGRVAVDWGDRGVTSTLLYLDIDYLNGVSSVKNKYMVRQQGAGSGFIKMGFASTATTADMGIMLFPSTNGCMFKDVYIIWCNDNTKISFEYSSTGNTAANLGYGSSVMDVSRLTVS